MMEVKDTVTIKASRDKVWAFLTDANKVAPCAPGVEGVEVIEDQKKYKAVAAVGFGNIKAKFNTDLEFVELNEPDYAKIKAHGTAPGSAADVIAEMNLSDGLDGDTVLDWKAEISIMGTIASLANRMMGSVTKKLATEFFNNVKKNIEE
jgi:carbon monoxide dehydrogenase subunit G